MTAVPELYALYARHIAESGGPALPFRTLVCGGSRLEESDYERIRHAFNAELCQGYGLTEFAPVSRNFPGHTRPGTVGPVSHRLETRISDEGEILLRGPALAFGYLGRPMETAEAFHDGWFHTGDFGRFDGGHLVFIRERKRTRKINGNMVDLTEIERALRLHPRVIEACLEEAGGELRASVVVRRDTEAGNESGTEIVLKKFLKAVISSSKIPKIIHGRNEDGEPFGHES